MTSTLVSEIIDRSSTLSTSSATILQRNEQRKAFMIQNISAVNVGINILGTAAAIGTAGTITLVPNGQLSAEGADCPKNGFTGIGASGTPALTVWEQI